MAVWTGLNINTGEVEFPKYNAEGVFTEIYIAALGTSLANGDTITGPIIQAGLFVDNVKVAVDKLDSASSGLVAFEVGWINNGTLTAAGFISTGNTAAQAGGITSMNVAAAYGTVFTNNVTLAAIITAAAGTAVAGNMRIGTSLTASP